MDDPAVGQHDVGLPVRADSARPRPASAVSAVLGTCFGHVSPAGRPGPGRATGTRPGGCPAWRGRRVPRRRRPTARCAVLAPSVIDDGQLALGAGGGGAASSQRRDRGVGGSRSPVQHDGDQVRPRPRHHPDQARTRRRRWRASARRGARRPVRAAPGRSHAARRRTGPRSASGSSRWVSAPHWVTSTCGRNAREQRRHDRVERTQPAGSLVPGGSGRLTACLRASPSPVLRREPGAGEQRQRGLVQRDREHPRVVVERRLHAVAVVRRRRPRRRSARRRVQQPGRSPRRESL